MTRIKYSTQPIYDATSLIESIKDAWSEKCSRGHQYSLERLIFYNLVRFFFFSFLMRHKNAFLRHAEHRQKPIGRNYTTYQTSKQVFHHSERNIREDWISYLQDMIRWRLTWWTDSYNIILKVGSLQKKHYRTVTSLGNRRSQNQILQSNENIHLYLLFYLNWC